MGIETLMRFLIGDRNAILRIAACPPALWIGALFVLSAGLARDYDGEDLLAEPWHLLIPFGASLGASLAVYFLTAVPGLWRSQFMFLQFLSRYPTFLALFWMTAPFAWLYAIPYERFLDPLIALRANLLTLAIVAAWRVALIIRVVSVLFGYPWHVSVGLVFVVADTLTLGGLTFGPVPLLTLMSGARETDAEHLMKAVVLMTLALGFYSMFLWVPWALMEVGLAKPTWQVPSTRQTLQPDLVVLAISSVLVWAPLLFWIQPEQQHRRAFEQAIRKGEIAAALDILTQQPRNSFPPQWNPPPRQFSLFDPAPIELLLTLLEGLAELPPSHWARQAYLEKLLSIRWDYYFRDNENLTRRMASLFFRLPERDQLLQELSISSPLSSEHIRKSILQLQREKSALPLPPPPKSVPAEKE